VIRTSALPCNGGIEWLAISVAMPLTAAPDDNYCARRGFVQTIYTSRHIP
jgi:hypothetical protein